MGKIFDEVNEKVFNTNTDFEELQGLCIDLAIKLEKAEQQGLSAGNDGYVDAGVLKDKIKTFIEGAKKMKEKSTNMEEDNYYRGKIDGIRLVERWLNLQNKSQHSK